MKNKVCKKLEGYAVYNKCMPTSIDMFFSGSDDAYNKELCEKYIQEHHSVFEAVKAILYYEIPEDQEFCNKGERCGENICYCDELKK